eukprot:scaffold19927_cov65-Phaeocystis_antarctica.AAC.10
MSRPAPPRRRTAASARRTARPPARSSPSSTHPKHTEHCGTLRARFAVLRGTRDLAPENDVAGALHMSCSAAVVNQYSRGCAATPAAASSGQAERAWSTTPRPAPRNGKRAPRPRLQTKRRSRRCRRPAQSPSAALATIPRYGRCPRRASRRPPACSSEARHAWRVGRGRGGDLGGQLARESKAVAGRVVAWPLPVRVKQGAAEGAVELAGDSDGAVGGQEAARRQADGLVARQLQDLDVSDAVGTQHALACGGRGTDAGRPRSLASKDATQPTAAGPDA